MASQQTTGEEIANSVSHGAGLIAALAGTPFLLQRSLAEGDGLFTLGVSVFCASMIFLYLTSTLYHALPAGRRKRIFRVVEHCAIFVLIAGTYTPFTLGVLNGPWGWTLLGLVWGLAAIGIGLKCVHRATHPVAFTTLYVLMGWVIVIAMVPLLELMPAAGLYWLLAGGIAYTLGVVFFATDSRLRYGHFIWHLFVLTGTTCHFFAVLWFAA